MKRKFKKDLIIEMVKNGHDYQFIAYKLKTSLQYVHTTVYLHRKNNINKDLKNKCDNVKCKEQNTSLFRKLVNFIVGKK